MRWPPPVRVSLAPSLVASLLIAWLGLGTCLVVLTLPLSPFTLAFGCAGIVLWTIDTMMVVGLRRGPRAVRGFELRGDL
ncbi:MAG TPA: hypothetical protein VGL90_08300, partial [Casimicrobiaceae bacterium]